MSFVSDNCEPARKSLNEQSLGIEGKTYHERECVRRPKLPARWSASPQS